ncbi:type III secretion system ATPase SctN [Aestuariispira insulae]|uniref:protein-secreting ATPase n=1 Tax=Aestuariispira insulae TaxID=1461337 RepID=A0A3D9H2K2_9PROT|nr:type III secretion system ATPase SctN [Aestuariispira insulae]RED43733.1 type III secretion system FliI/YscN family ATPase [Aestuariispira insulae]
MEWPAELSELSFPLDTDLREVQLRHQYGRVTQVVGTVIHAALADARLGDLCQLSSADATFSLEAEVVGFQDSIALLTPIGDMRGLSSSIRVSSLGRPYAVPVGAGLLGRILDGMGRPMDVSEKGRFQCEAEQPAYADVPRPLDRRMIDRALPMGVRALDGMLTCGEGQRIGIFAAAGGGKSTLLSMLVKGCAADVIVLALIGERGREVREFVEHQLGADGMARSVLVVATSDRPAMEQVKAAYTATAIAEYYREQGLKVVLMMDSVTRFARAQRSIGLAAGEPPTRRGYPPSVFAQLPLLLERTGQSAKGSITAFYTVLVEGDDMNEPVADETRSLLDGHIILSRELGAAGHYPAIDVLSSASRVMQMITAEEHRSNALSVKEMMAKFREVELLVKVGEYQQGADPLADLAIARIDAINGFLRQRTDDFTPFEETIGSLAELAV